MSQDNIAELTKAIKEMASSFHKFQLELATTNTRMAVEIEKLQKSDLAQWEIIRATQTKMMKVIGFFAGIVAVIGFLDIGARVKDILWP